MKARLLFALFSATAFAETDYDDAVKSFNNYPSKITEEVQWNVPYDETYLPYNVCENVGLHLTDWSPFDKTVCGIALLDSEGNVIFGKAPSVEECKAYDAPSLLNLQYAWRI